MSKTERIYALLVEANPVPDPEALPERLAEARPRLTVVDPRREPMQTEETIETVQPEAPRRTVLPALAAAAVIIAAVAIGAFLLINREPEPAVDPNAGPMERVGELFDALNAGEVEAAARLYLPDGSLGTADQHMLEFNATLNQRYPWQVEGCEVATTLPTGAMVECRIVNTDPVFVASGASELIAPYTVNEDGSIESHAWQGGDHTGAARAYADYLRAFHLEDYQAVCSPQAYPGGQVPHNGGLALTGACAEVILPLAGEIADWVEAGMPDA